MKIMQKQKRKAFQTEYEIKSSPGILFNFLSTSSGLSQWFADEVDINDNDCSFAWNGEEQKAQIIERVENDFIRYKWLSGVEGEYFEFKIEKAEVTGDTILIITDFADEKDIADQKMLWDSQVKTLMQQIGS